MRAWRNTYILYWYYVNVGRRWMGHGICQLHGNVHISRMAPCIHPIYGIGARCRRRLCSVHHERSWVLSRAHKAAFQQPTPKPVFVRFQATSTAVRNVCQPAEPALYPQVVFKSIGESELCVLTCFNSSNICISHGRNMWKLWLSNTCPLIARTPIQLNVNVYVA